MSALDRTFPALGGLLLALSLTFAAGCGASADSGTQASAADLSQVTTPTTLTDKVKAAYEQSLKTNQKYWLPGEQGVTVDKLPGAAKTDFDGDADTSTGYGYGYPEARVATVDGQTVYAISGIVSDTGNILGFYDANGTELCEAYSGQGEQPNAGGVDWWK